MLAAFTLALGQSSFSRFVSPLLRDAGVNTGLIGLFFTVWSGIGALAAPTGGILADTFGRRPILIAGRAISLLAWTVVIVWRSTAGLFAGAALMGFGWISGSAIKALIAESAAEGKRASAFAATGALDNLASVLGPLAVGLLSDRLGLRPVLLFMLAPYLAGVMVTTRVRDTLVRGRHTVNASSAWSTGIRYLLSADGRGSLVMGVIWALTGFLMGLTQPLWGIYVLDRYGVGYAGVGSLSSAIALGATLGQVLGGRLADRFGYAKIMVASLLSTASLWLFIPIMPSAALFTLMVALSNFLGWVAAPCWEALSAETARRRVRGAVGGIHSGMLSVGSAVGGGAFGLLYRPQSTLPFLALAVNDVVMLALILLGVRLGMRGFSWRPRDLSDDTPAQSA
jgi:MFS family permease